MQYLFVAYHYNANAIMAFPMKNRTDAEFTRVLIAFYKCCKKRGIPPNLHILDNECSAGVREIIKKIMQFFNWLSHITNK